MVDTDDTRRTTPWVWHKLPTGELKTRKQRYLYDLGLLTAASVKGIGAAMLQWLKPGNHYLRTIQAQSRNMINICTKYGFDSLIISGSYGGHRGHTTDD